tara:strand:- start:818 stop:2140 length:1323 start_codon:yes stop_codon:yes gene_type:complete
MGRHARRKTLIPRIWLTIVAFCQVFLTPFIAFSITYFFQISFAEEGAAISFDRDMLPWIIAASLMYGMIALVLALLFGGFRPLRVIEKGGWRCYLGLSRGKSDASSRRMARKQYANSPHGRLTVLAHKRWVNGHSILSTHGGLILLAVPFQVLLATVPLFLVLIIPDTVMHTNRRLELALLVYTFGLLFVMKIYPRIAEKYIGIASFTRKWLISMTKLSWLAPVLVLWLLGRVASVAVIGWMGPDLNLSINLEKELFETSLSIGSIPETSFLDLLTALAVMPLAAFTTIAVLGAGSSDPPEWMYEYQPPLPEKKSQSSSSKLIGKSVGVATTAAVLASTAVASKAATAIQGASAVISGSSSVAQAPTVIQSVGDGISHVEHAGGITETLPLEGEQLEFQGISDLFDQTGSVEDIFSTSADAISSPDFNQPSITGLRKSND